MINKNRVLNPNSIEMKSKRKENFLISFLKISCKQMAETYAFHFQPFHYSPCSPAALRNVEAKSLETRQYPSVVTSELHIWSEIFRSSTGKKSETKHGGYGGLELHKRSVLRRQSRDTNRTIKRSVYCQYG